MWSAGFTAHSQLVIRKAFANTKERLGDWLKEEALLVLVTAIITYVFSPGTQWERLLLGVVIPLAGLGAWVVVLFVWNLFMAPSEIHGQLSAEISDLRSQLSPEKVRNVLRRDWNGDWKDLANEFRGYAAYTSLRADWHHTSAGEGWRICGAGESNIVRAVEILCRNAGRLLVSSPKVSDNLSAEIRALADPVERWLYYMKKKGTFYRSGFGGTEHLDDGTTFHAYGGHIDSLPVAASNECLDCAGQEF